MSFKQQLLRWAPVWFQQRWMASLIESVGTLYDTQADRVMNGRLAANPYAGGARLADGRLIQCEEDALPYHARDRGIYLPRTAPVISNRYRLSRHHQLKQRLGTHKGTLENAQAYFLGLATVLPRIDIVHQNNGTPKRAYWHSIAAKNAAWAIANPITTFQRDPLGLYSIHVENPSNYNYDDRPTLRSRFWCFVHMYGTGLTQGNVYGGGTHYGDGSTYGEGVLTTQHFADIASMFTTWHATHSWCAGVALVWDNTSVPIDGTPTQDANGWWSLPNGAGTWADIIDPVTHLNTRPPNVTWIYDHPAP